MRKGTPLIGAGVVLLGAAAVFVASMFNDMLGTIEFRNGVGGPLQWMFTPLGPALGPVNVLTMPVVIAGAVLLVLGLVQRANDSRAFQGAAPKFS